MGNLFSSTNDKREIKQFVNEYVKCIIENDMCVIPTITKYHHLLLVLSPNGNNYFKSIDSYDYDVIENKFHYAYRYLPFSNNIIDFTHRYYNLIDKLNNLNIMFDKNYKNKFTLSKNCDEIKIIINAIILSEIEKIRENSARDFGNYIENMNTIIKLRRVLNMFFVKYKNTIVAQSIHCMVTCVF